MRKKKLKGASNFMSAMLVILVLSVYLLYGLAFNQDFAKKQKLDSICREYILRLETDSNLTAMQVIDFQNEVRNRIISDMGSNVDHSSIVVTVKPNTYGRNIELSVSCKVKIAQNKFIDGFRYNKNANVQYSEYRRTITSTSTE